MLSTLLHGARIIDGTGHTPYTTDLAIVDDRIALIGDLSERDAAVHIDCSGKTLAPGFIDAHSHSDELWLELPRCDGKIAQGVTTEIGGNCGTSANFETFDEFFSLIERSGVALNVASLVGLGTTRKRVAGGLARPLDRAEIDAQAALVREACEHGALGISSGLIYPPGMFASREELVAMAGAARDAGSPMYASHVRSESDELIEAIDEALRIGEDAGVRVQCSHHKAWGKPNWGKVHRTLEMIASARSRGIAVCCDAYPYTAGWTDLSTILPPDVHDGGPAATLERLSDPKSAPAIALYLQLHQRDNWHDILIANVASEKNANVAGMRIDEIARIWFVPPAWAVIRLLREENLEVGAIFFALSEDDVATVLSADFCCVGSDASARALSGPTAAGFPHPRTYGTFPRIFGRFVRGRRTFDNVEAVRRMTSLPADIFGLRDRGRIEVDRYADLVLFDEQTIQDTATYEKPHAFPRGIDSVFVNGRAVMRGGEFTGALPGRVLRGGA